MNLFLLFAEFFRIGLFSVGGGLATLPFLYRLAEKYAWLEAEMIPDMLAVAQSLPGGIGVNLGIYAGFRAGGIPGAVIAALGLVAPSVAVIILVAGMLAAFRESRAVKAVFAGLRPAAAGLLCAAFLLALRGALWNGGAETGYGKFRFPECAMFPAIFLLMRKIKVHPVVWIALSGAAGVILGL